MKLWGKIRIYRLKQGHRFLGLEREVMPTRWTLGLWWWNVYFFAPQFSMIDEEYAPSTLALLYPPSNKREP